MFTLIFADVKLQSNHFLRMLYFGLCKEENLAAKTYFTRTGTISVQEKYFRFETEKESRKSCFIGIKIDIKYREKIKNMLFAFY